MRAYDPAPDGPSAVPENAAADEFWEFEYRIPAAATGGAAEVRYEARRDSYERRGVRTGPGIGPHYFKRTGPPSVRSLYSGR